MVEAGDLGPVVGNEAVGVSPGRAAAGPSQGAQDGCRDRRSEPENSVLYGVKARVFHCFFEKCGGVATFFSLAEINSSFSAIYRRYFGSCWLGIVPSVFVIT